MIDVKTYEENSHRKLTAQIKGPCSAIFWDMCYIVRCVYDEIKRVDQSEAEDFKEMILIALNDPLFWSLDHRADESLRVDLSDIKSGGPT